MIDIGVSEPGAPSGRLGAKPEAVPEGTVTLSMAITALGSDFVAGTSTLVTLVATSTV